MNMLQYLDEDELEGEEGGERKVKKKRPKGASKASSTVSITILLWPVHAACYTDINFKNNMCILIKNSRKCSILFYM
jgi:hypothetical protein